jgi:hypothetical protein
MAIAKLLLGGGGKEISWIKAHLSARLSNFAVEQSSFSFGGKCWRHILISNEKPTVEFQEEL